MALSNRSIRERFSKSSIMGGFACAAAVALVAAAAIAGPAHAQSCSGDFNGDGRVDGVDLASVLAQWGNCPAAIDGVSPTHGSVLGGTVITLTGSGLSSATAVRVGGVLCSNLQILSSTQIRATTPAGAAGQAAIEVTAASGTAISPTAFNYVVQSVSSISPSSGGFSGGTPITITGQFLAGTTSVTVGGVLATNLVVVDANTLTAVTPAGSVGAVNVVVAGAKGSVTVTNGFTYLSVNTPSWATMLEAAPDAAVVTNPSLRNAITASGWAWRVRDNLTQIEMVLIPAGAFNMGCSPSTSVACTAHENPVHSITLTNPFYMGRYEVTQAQWTARVGVNPSSYQGQPDSATRPVDSVSWWFVQSFLSGSGLRLPTEAEWEYAYRAGTSTAFHSMPGFPTGTNSDTQLGNIAWFNGNSGGQTHPVGQKSANGFGLHDMSGNVWEWVNDWYLATYYSSSPSTNPPGPSTGTTRVARGGAHTHSTDSRSSTRLARDPLYTDGSLGFRVVRNP